MSLLENLKREPQSRTARKRAGALAVEVTDLYTEAPVALIIPTTINDNKTITFAKSGRSTRGKAKPVNSFWVIEKNQGESDPFNVSSEVEADRLKARLGGQHQARVYQAVSKFEAWELHWQFLIRVTRGHVMPGSRSGPGRNAC